MPLLNRGWRPSHRVPRSFFGFLWGNTPLIRGDSVAASVDGYPLGPLCVLQPGRPGRCPVRPINR